MGPLWFEGPLALLPLRCRASEPGGAAESVTMLRSLGRAESQGGFLAISGGQF